MDLSKKMEIISFSEETGIFLKEVAFVKGDVVIGAREVFPGKWEDYCISFSDKNKFKEEIELTPSQRRTLEEKLGGCLLKAKKSNY